MPAEHGELVAEHQDLQVLGGHAVGQQHEQLDRAAQRQVGKSWQHRVTSAVGSRGATVATRASMELTQLKGLSEYLHPTAIRWTVGNRLIIARSQSRITARGYVCHGTGSSLPTSG